MKKLLIVGGGFAGMWAALTAAHEVTREKGEIGITLVSRDPYLTLRPRLYKKNPETLRAPLQPVLDPVGISFVEGTVNEIDIENQSINVKGPGGEGISLGYDRLILATGSELKELPIPGMTEYAWNIDTYDAATALDQHLRDVTLTSDEPGHNTFLILGAGFAGIELVTEMRTRIEEHSDADTASKARVILVDRGDVVGRTLGVNPRPHIEKALEKANIETRLGVTVTSVDSESVSLSSGEQIDTRTLIVTVGLRASPLAEQLPVKRDELGRLPTDEMLRVKEVPGVYATGDIARAYVDEENLALMSCQHAEVMGRFAGYNAARDLLGLSLRSYRQPDYLTCLDLGVSGALFTAGWDREVQKEGEEAKQLKQLINCEWIYPPKGDRDAILAAAHIDARPYLEYSSKISGTS